ncbi:MAG: mechanosensitive ion channel domain-containing protein [Nitrospinota bacterium]
MENIFSAPDKILLGAAIVVGGYFLARFARASLKKAMGVFEWSRQVGSLITTAAYYAILVLSIMTGVATMGVNITPIIAALGLGGFALGFALRDVISNVLAGLLIIIYRPFSKGDYISVAGSEGKVEEVNLRYIALETGEGDRALVPNKMIFSNPVKVKKRK